MIERRLQPGPATLSEGERVTLLVSVQRHQPGAAPGRGWRLRSAGARLPYKVRCWTGSAVLHLVFFQAREAYLRRILPEGEERVVSGVLGRFGREWQIVHPELIALPDEFARAGPLQPLYPLTQGLGQRRLGRLHRRSADAAAGTAGVAGSGLARAAADGRASAARCAACTSPMRQTTSAPSRRRADGSHSTSCWPASWRSA